jgi:hypothetical protein
MQYPSSSHIKSTSKPGDSTSRLLEACFTPCLQQVTSPPRTPYPPSSVLCRFEILRGYRFESEQRLFHVIKHVLDLSVASPRPMSLLSRESQQVGAKRPRVEDTVAVAATVTASPSRRCKGNGNERSRRQQRLSCSQGDSYKDHLTKCCPCRVHAIFHAALLQQPLHFSNLLRYRGRRRAQRDQAEVCRTFRRSFESSRVGSHV